MESEGHLFFEDIGSLILLGPCQPQMEEADRIYIGPQAYTRDRPCGLVLGNLDLQRRIKGNCG